ncbi:hypothetical protein [Pseudomonas sp. ZS1P83]
MTTQPEYYPAPKYQDIHHRDLGGEISVSGNPGDIYVRVDTNGMPEDTIVSVFMTWQFGSEDHTVKPGNTGYVDSRIRHSNFADKVGEKATAWYTVKLPNELNKVTSDKATASVVE